MSNEEKFGVQASEPKEHAEALKKSGLEARIEEVVRHAIGMLDEAAIKRAIEKNPVEVYIKMVQIITPAVVAMQEAHNVLCAALSRTQKLDIEFGMFLTELAEEGKKDEGE